MDGFIVKIDDGYHTHVFELKGTPHVSINMLIQNAIKKTGLYILKEYPEGAKNTEQANQPDSGE